MEVLEWLVTINIPYHSNDSESISIPLFPIKIRDEIREIIRNIINFK